jgi:L-fuculose-phosphate aldolase
VKEKDIVEIDLKGNLLSAQQKISTEHKIHLYAYQKRKEVNAVVHCHPTYATTFALIGEGLMKHYLPEIFLTFGKVPLCKYATPSTDKVPKSLDPYIKHAWALLLQNHGALTLGKNLDDAFYKMEKLEHAAKIIFLARLAGKPKELSKKNVNELLKIAESTYGIFVDKRNI